MQDCKCLTFSKRVMRWRKSGNRKIDRCISENNRMNWGGWCFSWPTAFDRLVQSGDQMVYLEQSSYFSVSWRKCQHKLFFCFFPPFFKAQFPISLGHRRQLFSSWTSLKLQELQMSQKDADTVCGPFACGLQPEKYGHTVIWLSGIPQRTDWWTTWGPTYW